MEGYNKCDPCRNWSIAAAMFLNNLLISGSIRGMPILFVALVDNYEVSREEASWPFSAIAFVFLFSAPTTGFLSTRFSEWSIQLFGILLCMIGTSACFFSTNIYYISVFYGLIRGVGCSMSSTVLPGLINKSFSRYRATAMGIALTGMPIAGFIFPYLVQYLLDEFGLQGTFLMLGAISLHAAIGIPSLITHPNLQRKKVIITVIQQVVGEQPTSSYSRQETNVKLTSSESSVADKEITQQNLSIPEHRALTNKDTKTVVDLQNVNFKMQSDFSGNDSNKDTPAQAHIPDENVKKPSKFDWAIFWKIFKTPEFYLLAWTKVVNWFQISIQSLFIVDYLRDKGIGMSGAVFMITISAAGGAASRLGLGWITDRRYVSRQTFLIIVIILNGIIDVLITFTSSFGFLLFYLVCMLILQGTSVPTTAVLMSDYLMKEQFHLANTVYESIIGVSTFLRIALIACEKES